MSDTKTLFSDLAAIVTAWPSVPEPIREAVKAVLAPYMITKEKKYRVSGNLNLQFGTICIPNIINREQLSLYHGDSSDAHEDILEYSMKDVTPDVLHKEIDLIQSCIARMANNSFYVKGWALSIVAVVLALYDKDVISHLLHSFSCSQSLAFGISMRII